MKKRIGLSSLLFLILFSYCSLALAATVGNPLDLDLPKRSAALRQEIIEGTLDEAEQAIKIKAGLDLEFVFDKDLDSSSEVSKAEMSGTYYMAKLGITLFNRIEPFIKVGTSNLESEWTQNGTSKIKMEAGNGLAWGFGVKGTIWEWSSLGICLTGDWQFINTEADAEEIERDGTPVTDSGADFNIEEWQASLVLSKKYILPLQWQDVYIVPYTGFTFSDSIVDIKFTDPNNPGTDYSLFDANNKNRYGFLMGCDILPSLSNPFIYSIELRLLNEFALTLGGTLKF